MKSDQARREEALACALVVEEMARPLALLLTMPSTDGVERAIIGTFAGRVAAHLRSRWTAPAIDRDERRDIKASAEAQSGRGGA